LLQLACKQARISNPLKTVRDGEAADAYLAGTGHFADRKQYPLRTGAIGFEHTAFNPE